MDHFVKHVPDTGASASVLDGQEHVLIPSWLVTANLVQTNTGDAHAVCGSSQLGIYKWPCQASTGSVPRLRYGGR